MKNLLFVLSLCLATPAFAQDRIPDYSLSPAEMQQPGQAAPVYQQPGGIGGIGSSVNNYPNPATRNAPSGNRFMDQYCDPNFRVGMAANANMQQCLAQQKQQTCQQFQSLPIEVQNTLDSDISCAYNAANNNDGQTTQPNCATNDSQRLATIKKYWRDQTSVTALVFMPDDVLNAAQNCMRGNR